MTPGISKKHLLSLSFVGATMPPRDPNDDEDEEDEERRRRRGRRSRADGHSRTGRRLVQHRSAL